MIKGIQISVVPDGMSMRNGMPVFHAALCFKPGEGVTEAQLKNWPQQIAALCKRLVLQIKSRDPGLGWQGSDPLDAGDFSTSWKLPSLAQKRWSDLFRDGFGPIVGAVNAASETPTASNRFRARPQNRAGLAAGLSALKAAELAIALQGRHEQIGYFSSDKSAKSRSAIIKVFGQALLDDPLSLSFGAGLLAGPVQDVLLGTTRPLPDVEDMGEGGVALVRTVVETGNEGELEDPWMKSVVRIVRALEFDDEVRTGWVPGSFIDVLLKVEADIYAYSQRNGEAAREVWRALMSGVAEVSTLAKAENQSHEDPTAVAQDVLEVLRAASTLQGGDRKAGALFRATLARELLAEAPPDSNWDDAELREAVKASGRDYHSCAQYHRMMDIRNNALLASYFGFVVDFEWTPAVQPANGIYALSVVDPAETANGDKGSERLWSLALIDSDIQPISPGLAFRPASAKEAGLVDTSPVALEDGVIDLSAALEGAGPRYSLVTVDAKQALASFANAALAAETDAGSGELAAVINGHLPVLRTNGIELLDSGRFPEAVWQQAMSETSDNLGVTDVYLPAEALIVGFRFDVGVELDGKTEWFCPYERDIGYRFDGNTKAAPDLTTAQASARMVERSYGLATPSNQHKDDRSYRANETLLAWGGGNLALPARQRHDGRDIYVVEGSGQLPINMDLRYDIRPPQSGGYRDGCARGLPPLRDRFGYFVGARPVYVHCGGPSLADAYSLYEGGRKLGDVKGGALRFGVNEPIQPPEVLLRSERWEPLYDLVDLVEVPGSDDQTLVLRDGVSNIVADKEFGKGGTNWRRNRTVERYLVPPRVGFHIARIGGMFDRSNEGRPRGIFDRMPFERVGWSGSFPEAIGGGKRRSPKRPDTEGKHALQNEMYVPTNPVIDEAFKERRERPSRGQVLADGDRRVEKPYYPDPLAQLCCVLPFRQGQPLPKLLKTVPYAPGKQETGPDRRDATLPIVIRMVPAPSNAEIGVELATTGIYDGLPAFQTLIYHVPRGEEISLCCWSMPEDAAALARHGLWRQVVTAAEAGLMPWMSIDQLRQEAVLDILKLWPLPGLTGHRTLRLVHALQRPLTAPRFALGWDNEASQDWPFVRMDFSDKVAEAIDDGDQRDPAVIACDLWADIAANLSEPWQESHEEGARTIWLGGEITVHRPSTRQLVFHARWDEWDDSPQRPMSRDESKLMRPYHPRPGAWAPVETTRRQIENTHALDGRNVDLLKADNGSDACAYIEFADTRARDVELMPVAGSRFDLLYREPGSTQRGHFESPAPETYEGARAGGGSPATSEMELESGDVRYLRIPSTERPPTPTMDQDPLPLYRERRTQITRTNPSTGETIHGIELEREALTRVFLKRPWFGSGKGQQLGLILFQNEAFQPLGNGNVPPVSGNAITLQSMKDSSARDWVTMRGRDPTLSSGSIPNFLTGADIFGNDPTQYRYRLNLPVGLAEQPTEVAVVPFDVHADRCRDLWIADIGIKSRDTYMPFVRLGLAAYQFQSLGGLELSIPIVADAQLPPERRITVTRSSASPERLHIVVDGDAFRGRSPGEELEMFAHEVARPWLSVTLLERTRTKAAADGEHPGWKRRLGPPMLLRQAEDPALSISNSLWEFDVLLPELEGGLEYAIAIEEFEKVAADGMPSAGPGSTDGNTISVVEEFGRSADGLSAVVRGSTRTAALFELGDLEPRD